MRLSSINRYGHYRCTTQHSTKEKEDGKPVMLVTDKLGNEMRILSLKPVSSIFITTHDAFDITNLSSTQTHVIYEPSIWHGLAEPRVLQLSSKSI